jgi:hypothetical protein
MTGKRNQIGRCKLSEDERRFKLTSRSRFFKERMGSPLPIANPPADSADDSR